MCTPTQNGKNTHRERASRNLSLRKKRKSAADLISFAEVFESRFSLVCKAMNKYDLNLVAEIKKPSNIEKGLVRAVACILQCKATNWRDLRVKNLHTSKRLRNENASFQTKVDWLQKCEKIQINDPW